MKKIFITTLFLSLSLNLYSNDLNYIYNAKENIKINKIDNLIQPPTTSEPESPIINEEGLNICRITLTNLRASGTWGAAINRMRFIDGFGNDFNFGNTLTNTMTSATFQYGSISSDSTYVNSTHYYVKYSINGYELGSQSDSHGYWMAHGGSRMLTINFTNNTKLQGMHLADRVTCNPNCRGTITPYNVNLFSCENDTLIKTINITTPMSSVTGATGYINFIN